MRRWNWLLVVAILCLVPQAGFAEGAAQDDTTPAAEITPFNFGKKTPKPKFTTVVSPAEAKPGDEVTLSITAKLPQGYYIYSTTGDFDGRTKITVEAVGLEPVDADFQPDHEPKTELEPNRNVEVGKFYDEVTWSRKYRVKADATAATISGQLNGMYCGGAEAENPACVPIRPPYEIQAAVKLIGVVAETPWSKRYQPTITKKGQAVPGPMTLDVSLSPHNAQPGEKVTLTIKATLDDEWHTFALTHNGEGGVATTIDVPQLHGLKPLGEGFQPDQPAKIEEDKDLGITQFTHYNTVIWQREYEVLPEVGNYGLSGEIAYQTCRHGQCLPLKRVAFGMGVVPEQGDSNPVAGVAGGPGTKAPTALLPFLLLCFGGGLLALLTPCSFPMVPITVSFFLKQSEAEHKKPWLLALVYCGSIVAAFTILGVGISAFFGATKLNELANIPWLNIVIGSVFVLFALNMLGMFEIQMPGWLLTMTASKEAGGSYLGAVFMALTFTLTSFTCTFAIAGSLLVGAAQGEVYWPVIGMLAFGTAFAAPFFVLAMLPGLLKKLPKSGGWMNSVKVVMGLLELGAAVKFFSIADPGQVMFDHVTVMMIWFVISLVTAAYLFGAFRLPHDTVVSAIAPLRMLLGTGFLILSGLLLTGLTLPARGGIAVRQILAFAPARFEAGDGLLGPSLNHHGLEFALYFDKAVPIAKKENRPLLLDFTGVNCANCRDMELKMAQPAWKERIAKFVGVQLYVDTPKIPTISDATEGERLRSFNEQLELQLVQDSSMPAYAVVTPDGKQVLATYIGAEPATQSGTFVKFLDEGWAKWEQAKAKGGQAVGMTAGRAIR